MCMTCWVLPISFGGIRDLLRPRDKLLVLGEQSRLWMWTSWIARLLLRRKASRGQTRLSSQAYVMRRNFSLRALYFRLSRETQGVIQLPHVQPVLSQQ